MNYRRILIIKPSSLGDVVNALPVLASLRAKFSSAHIVWLVKRQWAELLERVEGLDEVWPVGPGTGDWLSQILRVRATGFDLAVDLQGLFRSGAIAWLSGCPARIGLATAREGSGCFYTDIVPVPSNDLHAVDRYLLVAEALGCAVQGEPEFRLTPRPGDREEVAKLLGRHGLAQEASWIAMSISARWPTKRWPVERFAAVADRLQRDGLGPVVLIGGPADRTAARDLRGLMRTVPVDLTGEVALGPLPALLQSASMLVTNDSGPMHIAAAMGTPVVALFGPTSPVLNGPYGKGHRVLRSGVPCSPCYSRRCRNQTHLECLVSISPDQVLEAVRAQLKAQAKVEVQGRQRRTVLAEP
jgi:lipopolysaccharide heptosyltransferase II